MTLCKITLTAAFILSFLFFNQYPVVGQAKSKVENKSNYFRNPLGIPISLSSNFGELRSTHWHMGLDMRTNQKENYRVYAAADGYIAYAGIRALSYGRFIIINHPNGLSTLYAHLNSFYPELEAYVKARQSEKLSWEVELSFTENQFPVSQGDIIGLSGNTGSSQGPHLHFEIRETKSGRCVNNLLFDFGIRDIISPSFIRLAIYDRSVSTYIQDPEVFAVKKTGNEYVTTPQVIITGHKKISFAIGAVDRVSGSSGTHGIYSARLFVDDRPQIEFILDTLNYSESDYVNAHVDQRYRNAGGHLLQHLSALPGYRGPVYRNKMGNGIVNLNDTNDHRLKIEITDVAGNTSVLKFQIRYNETLSKKIYPGINRKLTPSNVNIIEERNFEVFLPEECLYDTIPFIYSSMSRNSPEAVSSLHRFGDPVYHVHGSFFVRIKPEKIIPDFLREKVVISREWNGRRSVRKAVWRGEWLTAEFGDFGNFIAMIDTVPPQINPPFRETDTLDLSSLSKLVFTPSDNSGIRSFRAELDGRWLMFTNDKARSFEYIFDEQCPYGLHELKITVQDIAGNISEKKWWFKREPYTPSRKRAP